MLYRKLLNAPPLMWRRKRIIRWGHIPLWAIFIVIIFSPYVNNAQTVKKTFILIHGSFNLTQQMGSNDDYAAGDNDFPITPAHSEFGGGGSLFINLSKRSALQFSVDYLFGAEVKKEDPSDSEIFMYRTYNNVNVLANGIVKFGKKKQIFLICGAGINVLIPYAEKEVEGSKGSIIVLQPPDKKINPMAAFGGGVILNMKKMIFIIEALYTMIFNYNKNAILFRIGVGF